VVDRSPTSYRSRASLSSAGASPVFLRPGPQPENQIAGSFAEQFRRALAPRDPDADRPVTRRELRREVRRLRRELRALAAFVLAHVEARP
jgi:hypothetical protein